MLERPKGRATKVVITEYDLPRREIQPHDDVVDPDGMVWFSHFGEQFLSKMDPRTGKTTDYPIPVQKPDHPKGTLDLEVDQTGDIWVGLMYQTGVARFDRKIETFRMYPIPKEWQRDATQQSHFSVAASKVDGKAWVKNSDGSQIMRLDIATGEYENLGTFRNPKTDRPIGVYGIYADQQNNCYILEFPAGGIGKIDAKSGKFSFYPTPTPYARARRGRVDTQNRLWFAEFGGSAIGMFDPETEKISEYRNPFQWEAPYDVVADRNGDVWEVNETSDRIGRLNPRTAEITNYLMPRSSNFRRVFVDDRADQLAVWIGNNLGASIVRLEPTD
jgi:streptogramin lyase